MAEVLLSETGKRYTGYGLVLDTACKAMAFVSGITLVAMAIAWNSNSTIFGITAFAWAGFGAAFGPLMLFSLFWKRTTRAGAIAGMVAGGAMVFFWRGVLKPMGGVWGIYELLPAFVLSELTRALMVAFLVLLPFLVVDVVVANVLLATGLQAMSPAVVALPAKLLLFVMADGWHLLARALVLAYR